MKELISFLDGYVIERKLYWQVQTIYSTTRCEIQWQQGPEPQWQIRPSMEKNWIKTTSDDLVQLLSSKQINLIDFEEQLRHSLLQQIAYAKSVLEKGEALFGKESIDETVNANQKFLQSVAEAIESIVTPNEKTKSAPGKANQAQTSDATINNQKSSQKSLQKSRPNFLRLLDESANYNRS